MEKRNKLAIFDLDGTLFDTKNVNFTAYSKALENCGLKCDIDYEYYCDFCNGNNYKVFLPKIVEGITDEQLKQVHDEKKKLYKEFLHLSRKNEQLFSIIDLINVEYQIALVTVASKENALDILTAFSVVDKFDFIITQEDVEKTKPDPEGFTKAINKADVSLENTIIFEDSETGIKAAEGSGAKYVKVYGYN